ncbi:MULTISPECIES: zinc-dependent alcohol dehydrogenase family protein [unclassified Peribacillus]|uniref:zinc-dependent alcohol dehydrogenase family protein n=1 Tax=unclassified Peribacillus TaxID=2675266 RepID=UPI00191446EC|nr:MULTISPECIES: zinc-binding dehydrogenase [unclassified Peribacillus]MBK5482583.1 zinc-binding dehydrogenase [Peribacillus sp. TH16]MBK5502602.1 zinc-binding dehydrogenase [Peribacillus sp. TH14]
MKAVIFPGDKKVEIREMEIPTPGMGEVLIQMKASAICRSDMSLYYGTSVFEGTKLGSIVPGHEPAGIITELGEGVTTFKTGDRVAVYLALGCGECAHCKSGYKMFCKEFKCIGFDSHGGDADYMVVPAENCMRLPDDMSFLTAAVSTDAVGTLFHAQKRLAISGRDKLVIFGMGPMGAAGVMIGNALGATVIAVDMLDERLEMAKELGAAYIINGKNANVQDEISRITNGLGADAAIDCSGSPFAQNDALDCVRAHGRVAFVGESKETTIKPSAQLIRKQISVIGSWYFPIQEFDEITEFIVRKKLPVERLVTHKFRLEEAETAFQLFDERKTEKAVFVWE